MIQIWVTAATVVIYLAVLFTVAYISGHRADNAGFFVGNRRSNWVVVTIATIGSAMSGVTFVSVPGMVATAGFSYFQMALGFLAGQLIIAFVLIPLYYRMNLVSIYGYLEQRFGMRSYRTGAWFFFISKLTGASVRLFLAVAVLQLLVFGPLGIPFWLNAALSIAIVFLYTRQGGVKSIIWTDTLKTVCLVTSIVLSICLAVRRMDLSFAEVVRNVADDDMSRMFFFDDVNDRRYFFKQFLAGIAALVATTGLDQDLMQRTLSCRTSRDARKNIIVSAILQTVVILLFLVLGVVLYQFAAGTGITLPEGTDNMFPSVAFSGHLPLIVGILFILGLVSATYSSAGSAMTALTTSFTIDILQADRKNDEEGLRSVRMRTHIAMAGAMFAVICLVQALNSTSVIDAVYTLASYTYGPILGLFMFGICTKVKVRDRWVGVVAVAAPVVCFILQQNSERWMGGYRFSYELLVVNALLTIVGLLLIKERESKTESNKTVDVSTKRGDIATCIRQRLQP